MLFVYDKNEEPELTGEELTAYAVSLDEITTSDFKDLIDRAELEARIIDRLMQDEDRLIQLLIEEADRV